MGETQPEPYVCMSLKTVSSYSSIVGCDQFWGFCLNAFLAQKPLGGRGYERRFTPASSGLRWFLAVQTKDSTAPGTIPEWLV